MFSWKSLTSQQSVLKRVVSVGRQEKDKVSLSIGCYNLKKKNLFKMVFKLWSLTAEQLI